MEKMRIWDTSVTFHLGVILKRRTIAPFWIGAFPLKITGEALNPALPSGQGRPDIFQTQVFEKWSKPRTGAAIWQIPGKEFVRSYINGNAEL